MKKLSNTNTTNNTSYHNVDIRTTPKKLIELAKKLDAPFMDENDGSDKVNFDFEFETEKGTPFTVYDWKYYRPLRLDETVDFHIGSFTESHCKEALGELREALK